MSKTVDAAFREFIKESVDIDPNIMSDARDSKEHLKKIIAGYNGDNFFHLCKDFNEEFGSFARKTKMGILDDIDMMFGISADGAIYDSVAGWQNINIYGNPHIKEHRDCMDLQTGLLNSKSVLNKFKERLGKTYSTSDHPSRDGEAVRLKLTYDWSFDIVPCFQTRNESDGRNYYLIPNGYGGWKKTDPRLDRDLVQKVDRMHNGKVLPLIRLCKKWFDVKRFETPASYLIETLVVRYCIAMISLDNSIEVRFINFLSHLLYAINLPVYDMKNIQGDINTLNQNERLTIQNRAKADLNKARIAHLLKTTYIAHQKAISLWHEIFGEDFPTYG